MIARGARLCSVAIATLGAACTHWPAPTMVANPPVLTQPELAPPPQRITGGTTITHDSTVEVTVSIDTHGRESDVRDLLGFLGQTAGIHFVFSPEINKRIRITLNDVPVSTAIEAVLAEANLTLEGSKSLVPPPTPSVVFYQLPVNIDSLSVESIMKRFGVGRAVAEILVQSRPEKP
jgi:hypothetical protein